MLKTVTIQMPPISVQVNVEEGFTDKEIAAMGEKEVIKQLSKSFPRYQINITNGQVINDTEVIPGRPVKLKDSGEIGIIYDVKPNQKYPIKVVLRNGKLIGCTVAALENASKKVKIEKLISGRESWEKELGEWYTGKTAYFLNGNEIIPVVLTTSKSKVKAFIVDHSSKGKFYNLSIEQAKLMLFDTYSEAESKKK